ncbi:ribokinase protein [Halorhabdus tiamatea SARL4B]|uniref:Ribokinase n=1 Tax=Halorhabdus tiamatea SARL4B TaxID=1033806 RepID=F7PN42_9EURY|nr:ribokinase [Halorhabdus tiamatea]ERJ07756.1 ribokinase protein [Halorhabdus tiamatea SARL4B]CCQ32585.1 ribokinase [Halorhabdus tiamatea SARL4B]
MGNVYVAGSINQDIAVRLERRPQPGETVPGESASFGLGGKGANQAIAAARSGAAVELIGAVGDDRFGEELLADLDTEDGLSTAGVHRASNTSTGVALITVDADSENAIVAVPGANAALAPADVGDVGMEDDAVVLSQFEIPQPTIRTFFEQAHAQGARTVLNPAPAETVREDLLERVDFLVVNETEALFYADGDSKGQLSQDELVETAAALRTHDEQVVVVTLGEAGVFASTPSETIELDAYAVDPVDTTGAGDAFVGAFATALGDGLRLRDALDVGAAAGALATTQTGAAPSLPTRAAIEDLRADE